MRRIPRLVSLVVAGAVAVGVTLGPAGPAQAVAVPSGWAELFNPDAPLVNNSYHMCLDLPGGTTRQGAALQMYHCHGYASNGAPQRWVFTHLSDDSYWISNVSTQQCVTAFRQGAPLPNNGFVGQDACNQFEGQTWYIAAHPSNPDLFMLENTSPTHPGCLQGSNVDQSVTVKTLLWAPCDSSNVFQIWGLG